MAGKSSAQTVKAVRLMMNKNLTAYAAAQQAKIAPITLYRSRLYRLFQAGQVELLKGELAALERFHAGKKKAGRKQRSNIN
jgi:hypothetical protein